MKHAPVGKENRQAGNDQQRQGHAQAKDDAVIDPGQIDGDHLQDDPGDAGDPESRHERFHKQQDEADDSAEEQGEIAGDKLHGQTSFL